MKQRVLMAMSGGVDSSVAAALLQKAGYDVIGAYILGWTGTADFPCAWQQEEADARRVAEQLGIPFYTINLSKEYEQAVIDRFFGEYARGLTPNPDILCNKEIKFKALWQAARQFEPDLIATGHYARIIHDDQGHRIYKGIDENKDQTYFLWGIDRSMLDRILFPIGQIAKPAVRKLAAELNLPTAQKKDSQGICFVGPLKVREFLASRLSAVPGQAVLADGRVVGSHQGTVLYTIGQRLGAGSVDWTGDVPPLFVVAKDLKQNLLVVGRDDEVYADQLIAGQPNWLVEVGDQPFVCSVKIRYRQEDVEAQVLRSGERLIVNFSSPVRAITAGQSIVFYDKSGLLMGGAIIEEVPAQQKILKKINGKIIAQSQVT